MNALYWLELRVRTREKRLWLIALFFIITLAIITGVILATTLIENCYRTIEPLSVGAGMTWAALFCQAGLLILLAPLATAGRIAQEREQRTLAGLINTPETAARIALGKLWGSWTFVLWLGVLVLPFPFTATLWGGPTWQLIMGGVAVNLLAGLVLAAVSLGISGLFGRSLTAYLVTGSFLFGWVAVLPMLGTMAAALHPTAVKSYQEIVMFITMYHNPFAPMTMLVKLSEEGFTKAIAVRLGFCLGVWILLGIGSLALAIKSLKREVY